MGKWELIRVGDLNENKKKYAYGNVEEDGIELLQREQAGNQHWPVELIHHNLQVAAILQFSLKQLRDNLAPL